MDIRFAAILLLSLSVVTALERTKRGGAMHDVEKSGEKLKKTTESKDNYVTCAPPFYKCCGGASGVMSTVISEKCLRDDGEPGLCCGSDALTLVEVEFENGTKQMVRVSGAQAENKAKLDHLAEEVAEGVEKKRQQKIKEEEDKNREIQKNLDDSLTPMDL